MSDSPILLGADPELIFVGENGLVSAGDYLPRQVRNGKNPPLGADGHPYTAEIRPDPAQTPKELVANIKKILKDNQDKIPGGVAWQAGSFVMDKSIGGHIHFGNTGSLQDQQAFVDLLDGVMLQFIILMEDEVGARKRRSSDYGQLGDCRSKGYGHFEYRPLPSWIVSEQISLGVVALAKALLFETLEEGPHTIKKLKGELFKDVSKIDRQAFRTCNKSYFYSKFDNIYKLIRRLLYWQTDEGKELWKNVALLKHIIKNYPDWHNDKDILDRWGIRKTPKTYKFERIVQKPVIQLDEVVTGNVAWNRIVNGV